MLYLSHVISSCDCSRLACCLMFMLVFSLFSHLRSSLLPKSLVFMVAVRLTHGPTRACFCFNIRIRTHDCARQLCKSSSPTSELQTRRDLHFGQLLHDFFLSFVAHALKITKNKLVQKSDSFLAAGSAIDNYFGYFLFFTHFQCQTPAYKNKNDQESAHAAKLFLNKQINKSIYTLTHVHIYIYKNIMFFMY